MIFLDKLNELTQGKYGYLRVKSLEITTKPPQATIEILAPYDVLNTIFGDVQRTEVEKAVGQILPPSIAYKINYIKSFVDENIARMHTVEFFKRTYPTILIEESDVGVKITNEFVDVTLKLKTEFYKYLLNSRVEDNYIEYMSHCICNPTKIAVIDSKKEISFETDFATEESIVIVSRKVNTTDHEVKIGKVIGVKPRYIIDMKDTEKNAVYCGEIVDFKRNISKKTGFPYYILTINDTTGLLCCKAFTKNADNNPYDELEIGQEIIMTGNVELDTFMHDRVLLVRDLSLCTIDKSSIILKEELREEPTSYTYVKPEKYNDMRQASLFEAKNVECPADMMGKTFVVFDFETTGLLSDHDAEPIEIGAVKVIDGVITESFGTFIKPKMSIPPFITELTNITNDDVANAPAMSDIVGDFYKFTRGSALVAHNASFDKTFLDRAGKSQRYLFDNQVYDTCGLAKGVVSAANYKLITLCNKFNISLEGAHRAVNDCEATAKLFIELVRLGALK